MVLLEVKDLTKNFGGLTAVGDVTMELHEGELVGLIGPNGAGKTTLFNLLTGVYEPSEGTITLAGTLLNGKAPSKIASLGLGRTFQNIRLFKNMTVLENVLIGLGNHGKAEVFASFFRLPAFYKNEESLKTKAIELLKIFDLDGDVDTLAKNLPYGQQRRLEIVREDGRTSPDIVRRIEVLPAPLAPIKVTTSPSFTSNDTFFTASMTP